MNFHFIAIGGSAMHNLAIALHLKGERVTGSDDEIFSPGALGRELGWSLICKIKSNCFPASIN